MSTFNVSCLRPSAFSTAWWTIDKASISKFQRYEGIFPFHDLKEQDQLVTYSGKDNREFLVGGGFVVTVWARSSVSCCFKLSTKERCFPQRCRVQIKEPRKALHLVVLHQCLPVPHSSNCPLFAALSPPSHGRVSQQAEGQRGGEAVEMEARLVSLTLILDLTISTRGKNAEDVLDDVGCGRCSLS